MEKRATMPSEPMSTTIITIGTNPADAESMKAIYAGGDWAKIIQGVTNLLGNPDNAVSLRSAPAQPEHVGQQTPSVEEVNSLPAHLRKYIHDIEAKCDPAGDIRTIGELRDTIRASHAEN
jgi:hypothetical protein